MARRGSIFAMALLLSTGMLTACKSKTAEAYDNAPVLKVGAAPPGKPVTVGKPEKNGALASYAWPEACQYLTEADVRAILPSATSVTLKQESVVFATSAFGKTKETIRDAQCTAEVLLPEKTDTPGSPLRINVVERGYGTVQFAKWNYEKNVVHSTDDDCPAAFVKANALDTCKLSGDTWLFLKKRTTMEVSVDSLIPYGARIEGMPDIDSEDQDVRIHAAREFWETGVASRFVAAVASRTS